MAQEENEILNLANLMLSTLNLFPRVTHSALMVVVFTACLSTALAKLCVAPELIKIVLQYTHYIFYG